MSRTVRSAKLPVAPDAATRVVPSGQHATPLPPAFPFLRPPQAPGEWGRLGGYRVFKLLGSGGMGKVFLAEDLALARDVALKVMCLPFGEDLQNWRERFLREARALAAIKHPNLVGVYQAGEDRGTVFLAMELLEGETLDARVRREAPLAVADVVQIAEQVAHGLSAIHDRGLIHRDIKPANIWLARAATRDTEPFDGSAPAPPARVKILDFGLVREVKGDTQLTEAGAVVGTPAYMSPEQVRGHELDTRTDLFSFGCVLYAMCTGRPPFAADNPMAQAAALAADTPARVRALNPAVPRALSALIAELLAKNPDERPASAAEVAERLRAIGAGEEIAPPARSFFLRHAVKLVACVWLVLAALLVVAFTREPRGAAAPPTADRAEGPAPAPAPSDGGPQYLSRSYPIRALRFPPPGHPPLRGTDGTVCVGGVRSPNGIFMPAAPHDHLAPYLTFGTRGEYTRFQADVSLNDSARGLPTAPAPVEFVVTGDGRELWRSRAHQPGDPMETCDLDIRGVNSLTLSVVLRGGHHHGAHAVWIEPRLLR